MHGNAIVDDLPAEGHSAVVHDEHLIVFGGKTKAAQLLNIVWAAVGGWADLSSRQVAMSPIPARGEVPTPRSYHTAHVFQGAMYVIHGFVRNPDATHRYAVPALDLATGEWRSLPSTGDVPELRCHHASVHTEGTVFLCGGTPSSTWGDHKLEENVPPPAHELYELNLVSLVWTAIHDAPGSPSPRLWGHSMIPWDEGLLIYGGVVRDRSVVSDILWVFSCTRREWRGIQPFSARVTAPFTATKQHEISLALGDNVIVKGVKKGMLVGTVNGKDGWFPQQNVDVPKTPTPRVYQSSTLIEGLGMMIWGGEAGDEQEKLADAWILNVASFKWEPLNLSSPPPSTTGLPMVWHNGYAFLPNLIDHTIHAVDPLSRNSTWIHVRCSFSRTATPLPAPTSPQRSLTSSPVRELHPTFLHGDTSPPRSPVPESPHSYLFPPQPSQPPASPGVVVYVMSGESSPSHIPPPPVMASPVPLGGTYHGRLQSSPASRPAERASEAPLSKKTFSPSGFHTPQRQRSSPAPPDAAATATQPHAPPLPSSSSSSSSSSSVSERHVPPVASLPTSATTIHLTPTTGASPSHHLPPPSATTHHLVPVHHHNHHHHHPHPSTPLSCPSQAPPPPKAIMGTRSTSTTHATPSEALYRHHASPYRSSTSPRHAGPSSSPQSFGSPARFGSPPRMGSQREGSPSPGDLVQLTAETGSDGCLQPGEVGTILGIHPGVAVQGPRGDVSVYSTQHIRPAGAPPAPPSVMSSSPQRGAFHTPPSPTPPTRSTHRVPSCLQVCM